MAENRITEDRDLHELIRMMAETMEIECRHPRITPELRRVWDMWEASVQTTLRGWAKKHVRPEPDKWATIVILNGYAPLNVWLTVAGHGVGIWDGRWDEFFPGGGEKYLENLQRHLERYLGFWMDRIDHALMDAASDCAQGELNG